MSLTFSLTGLAIGKEMRSLTLVGRRSLVDQASLTEGDSFAHVMRFVWDRLGVHVTATFRHAGASLGPACFSLSPSSFVATSCMDSRALSPLSP